MAEVLARLFGLYNEAVIAVSGGQIAYFNEAAKRLLPRIGEMKPDEIFPAEVLEYDSDGFAGEFDINGKRVTYSAAQLEKYRIFSILSSFEDKEKISAVAFSAMSVEMKGYLNLLRTASNYVLPYVENTGDKRLGEYAAMINKCYYNILRLTSNMETLGYEVSGHGLVRSRFDIVLECRELINTCAGLVNDSGVKLSFNSPHAELVVFADKDKITQMLLNLLSNSIIRTEKGGKITLSVRKAGEKALIKLQDTGSGIPDLTRQNLLKRYGESKMYSDAKSGAGFGMAAVSMIAKLHGGNIIYDTRAGKGTTITIPIPISDGEASSVNNNISIYNSGSEGISAYLTGLSTVIGNDKFMQKYMD